MDKNSDFLKGGWGICSSLKLRTKPSEEELHMAGSPQCSFRIMSVSQGRSFFFFFRWKSVNRRSALGYFSPGWFCHTQHFGTQPSLIGCLWAPPSGESLALQPSKRPTPARKRSAKELVTNHELNHQSIRQSINQFVK